MNIRLILLVLLVVITGCATKRTKYSDKNMRVMVDPTGLSHTDYMNLQTALVQSNMWTVLDRSLGLNAIKNEQNQIHKYDPDRYENQEKFAHWGKLYGVGAVIVAHSRCQNRVNPWNQTQLKNYCRMFINVIDANTGEVIVGVQGEESAPFMAAPEWDDLVSDLGEAYPKYFEDRKLHDRLKKYKKESEAAALAIKSE